MAQHSAGASGCGEADCDAIRRSGGLGRTEGRWAPGTCSAPVRKVLSTPPCFLSVSMYFLLVLSQLHKRGYKVVEKNTHSAARLPSSNPSSASH